jgi:hypothetical protein
VVVQKLEKAGSSRSTDGLFDAICGRRCDSGERLAVFGDCRDLQQPRERHRQF